MAVQLVAVQLVDAGIAAATVPIHRLTILPFYDQVFTVRERMG
ncbi:hypothetical protein [cf. Phormidesmis sp. LEGE 11477]|nr:hypothetical protein [cf. Phormidesmis sp. LEGE 11477]